MHEVFEHTADLGFRIRAGDLNTLFQEAATVLFETIVPELATVKPTQKVDIQIDGADREFLLFDWLKHLLYHFDAEHLLLSRFEVEVREDGLSGTAWGEPLDHDRHVLEHEVKAVTYHELRLEKIGDAWLAEVIVDI